MRGFNKEVVLMPVDVSYWVYPHEGVKSYFFWGGGGRGGRGEGGLFSWKNPVNCVWERVDNSRRKMERWLTDVYVGPWLKIYFSWGFWLSWMLRWILGLLFVYWFWKPLAHSCVFMWFNVPVRHREMDDKFWRKYFNNPTHLISKLRLLGTFSQKKLEKKKIQKKDENLFL